MASELDKLQKVGIGTATTLSAPGKAAAATSITVGSTANFPTTTGITFAIRVVDGNGELVAGTYTEWVGTVTSGTTLAMNAVPVYGSDQVYTAGSTTQVYMPLSSYSYNKMIDGLLEEHEQLDGTHKATLITSRTEDTTPDVGADFLLSYDTSAAALKKVKPSNLGLATGWISGQLPAVSSVTENGNRSADITFASTVASILTPGMRIRTSRTVAAPTYMGGAFNGTTHYFTKVTPTSTLSTITDNITIVAHIEPTAYAACAIAARYDSTTANGIGLQLNASGQIVVQFTNGGGGNSRIATSYQSVPLNKKSHIAATYTSTATTFVIYLDGVSIPFAVVTGGTAPTTFGTGTNDFSIGRYGANASGYFPGYISGCGVFNAVLSAATIRSYKNQVLSGSETNCIGAWSLNNTAVNQQAAGTNDLTATGGVGYTSGRSPYTTDANGVAAGTYDWAIVTKVNAAVATVQYPEGCAIPTSGGISTVDYSGVKSPFGMPVDSNRWAVMMLHRTSTSQGSAVTSTWYNIASNQLSIPVGAWKASYRVATIANSSATAAMDIQAALSTANNTASDLSAICVMNVSGSSLTQLYQTHVLRDYQINNTAATTYYLNTMTTAGAALTLYNQGSAVATVIEAQLAHL